MGTKTIQMQSVDTKVGTAISPAPSMTASYRPLPMCRCRSMFSIVTVASSTKMPTARASPPSVMMLMVCPIKCSTISDVKMERGIEIATITVVRQLPKKSNNMSAVSPAARSASWITPEMACFTKTDWSASSVTSMPSGSRGNSVGSMVLILLTTSRVDAPPFFRAVSNRPRSPSWRTILICGEKPSLTWATSRK